MTGNSTIPKQPNTAVVPLPGDVMWRSLLASKYLEPLASLAFGMLRLFLVHVGAAQFEDPS